MSETYSINGLQFSRPFRTIIEPHFQLLESVGAKSPLLFGEAIWAVDHLQLRPETRFNYIAHLPPNDLMPMARKLQATLSDRTVIATPHAAEGALELTLRFNTRPVRVIFLHHAEPDIPTVIAAAPTADRAAVMTNRQEIEVRLDYMQQRQQPDIASQPEKPSHSHAFSWIYW